MGETERRNPTGAVSPHVAYPGGHGTASGSPDSVRSATRPRVCQATSKRARGPKNANGKFGPNVLADGKGCSVSVSGEGSGPEGWSLGVAGCGLGGATGAVDGGRLSTGDWMFETAPGSRIGLEREGLERARPFDVRVPASTLDWEGDLPAVAQSEDAIRD
ncbi:MAG TPA: hypothetical protein VF120_12775 [Ktedonobacterales bacterium]